MNKNDTITAALIAHNLDARAAYNTLGAKVGFGSMIFMFNPGAGLPREARAIGDRMYLRDDGSFYRLDAYGVEIHVTDPTGARKASHRARTQHEMCLRMCYAIARDLRKAGNIPGPNGGVPTTNPPRPEPPVEVPVEPPTDFDTEVEKYLAAIAQMRRFVKDRNNFDPLDSYRLEEDGIRLLAEGIPAVGILTSIAAAWSKDSRAQFTEQTGIPLEFDYQSWGRANGAPEDLPGESEYLYRVLKAGVFAYCHGPSQIGKSYGLKYAAMRLGLDYYETCVPGAMPSAIKGKYVGPDHYVDSAAKKAYRDGGLFNIDEIDFGEPDVLGSINNAITNGTWHCDVTDTVIKRHTEKFRLAATANTLGQGTDKRFQRNVIDGATQERFRLGRIEFKHDPAIASKIARDQVAAAKSRIKATA